MAPGESYNMPLRAVTLEELEKLRENASCDLIFHNRGVPWTYRQIQYAYNKAFKMAKLPYTSTHVCRHTGATKFLDETNGDYLALQQMGNWSDLKQALHYGKTLKDRARKAVQKADKRGQVSYLKAVNS
jgi:integrase